MSYGSPARRDNAILMNSQKVVTPVKTGVQVLCNCLKRLDSGFRRNEVKRYFMTFCEFINIELMIKCVLTVKLKLANILLKINFPVSHYSIFEAAFKAQNMLYIFIKL
jgi:hypothetical protein